LYPANWTAQETDLEPKQVVRIIPNEFLEDYRSPVGFVITYGKPTSDAPILSGPGYLLSNTIDGFENLTKTSSEARFVNSTRDITLSGLPAYSILYYDYTRGLNLKILDTMTVYNSELLDLQYYAEPGYFNKYAPLIMKMIESLQITLRDVAGSIVEDIL
jgi:hypothetical protein